MRQALVIAVFVCILIASASAQAATQPLHASKTPSRYFVDPKGRAVYLTGSHVWWNLVGGSTWGQCFGDPPAPFDYAKHLRRLKRYGHNFIRLWRIGLIRWQECGAPVTPTLQPWLRTGPGLALDGRPRLDLHRFDQHYFSRLRARVAAADRAGIYVSVMLFEGWGPQFAREGWAWKGSPYNPANNVNSIDADIDKDGTGVEAYTLAVPALTRLQEAYVRKVVDSVGRFHNVLYEIANEAGERSTSWQYHMIRVVRQYEGSKGQHHPIGMSYQHGDPGNDALRRSGADWIAPFGSDWVASPPPASGRQVVVLDTDHLCGVCGGSDFVWKSFVRGYNPVFMDPFDAQPEREQARLAMGRTRALAQRLQLRRFAPSPSSCSTRYCLTRGRTEFVIYQPEAAAVSINLRGPGVFRAEWLHTTRRLSFPLGARRWTSGLSLRPPWPTAVLHVWRAR